MAYNFDLEDWEKTFDESISYHRYCDDPYCIPQHRRVNIFEVKQFIEELLEYREKKIAESIISVLSLGEEQVRISLREYIKN